jgi:hypothetical protein
MANIQRENCDSKDKRDRTDRRVKPTPFLSRYTLTGGQRRSVRRKHDRRKHIFVDVYDPGLFIAIFALLIMNVLDGFLTLLLINHNLIVEANPFMAFWLDFGHLPFFWVKYVLMAAALFIFCIFKGFRISNIALLCSLVIYGSVVLYQLHLVYEHYPSLFFQ